MKYQVLYIFICDYTNSLVEERGDNDFTINLIINEKEQQVQTLLAQTNENKIQSIMYNLNYQCGSDMFKKFRDLLNKYKKVYYKNYIH